MRRSYRKIRYVKIQIHAMLLSNPARPFAFLILFFLVFLAGCSSDRSGNTTAFSETESLAGPPFPTAEPDHFQAEIIVTAGSSSRTFFTARKGERRRYDYDRGTPREITYLAAGGDYMISPGLKAYALIEPQNAGDVPDQTYTTELLNVKDYAEFQNLGTEGSVTKYSAKLNGSDSTRVYLYIDPAVGFPVKQEFFSVRGGKEVLQYTMEVRNFSAEVDDSVFDIPPGLRKVSTAEMERLRAGTR
jgi:hypothetical protein